MSKLTKARDALQAQMDQLQEELNYVVHKILRTCSHKDVIEVPHVSGYWSRTPHRVCAQCGAQEDGWHNQFISKLHPTRELSRDDALYVRNQLLRHSTERTQL